MNSESISTTEFPEYKLRPPESDRLDGYQEGVGYLPADKHNHHPPSSYFTFRFDESSKDLDKTYRCMLVCVDGMTPDQLAEQLELTARQLREGKSDSRIAIGDELFTTEKLKDVDDLRQKVLTRADPLRRTGMDDSTSERTAENVW